ncbi:uncharacterized protein [Polyergus mexicanus]|uniref:uncharacterized protein isoform X2 n=1 Tax=Polyergus mexicanus TaxID=615972 RepID=UPI0038B6926F
MEHDCNGLITLCCSISSPRLTFLSRNLEISQEWLDKESDCQTGIPSRVQRVKSFAEAASAELLSIRLLAEFTEAALPRTEHDRTIVSSLVHVASIDLLRVRRFRERPHTADRTVRREKFPGGSMPRCQLESPRNRCLKHTLVTLLRQCAT